MDNAIVKAVAEKLINGVIEALNNATADVPADQRLTLTKHLRRYFPDAHDIHLQDDGTATTYHEADYAEFVTLEFEERAKKAELKETARPSRVSSLPKVRKLHAPKKYEKVRPTKLRTEPTKLAIELGQKAVKLRKQLNLTQTALAAKINAVRSPEAGKLAQYDISVVERGLPCKQLDANALIEFLNQEKQKLAESMRAAVDLLN